MNGYKHTFNVRASSNAEPVEFSVTMPKNLDDMDLIVQRYGSVERLVDRANATWTVDVATGIRKRLKAGDVDGAKRYADSYCDDGRRDTFSPKLDAKQAKALGFTKEQLAALKAAGMKVE